MIHQLRIYKIVERNKQAFHQRFRDHAARIMLRHGFRIVAMWEASGAGSPEFVYILEWPDERAKASAWETFMADEEWARIKRETGAVHGSLVGGIEDRTSHADRLFAAPRHGAVGIKVRTAFAVSLRIDHRQAADPP